MADTPASVNKAARPARASRRPADAKIGKVWIDLLNPTPTDEAHAHAACGQRIPSREDLSEVESSSRHYMENGAIYLSAPLLSTAGDRPILTPVGFIVTADRLVTVRFDELKAFTAELAAAEKAPPATGYEAFTRVLEAVIDREADILELVGEGLEECGRNIFKDMQGKRRPTNDMRDLLRALGHSGEKLGKLRHSLATLGRIAAFVVDNAHRLPRDLDARLNSARDDVDSLAHFQEALNNKLQFLLDAALGFINIDQNDVIKVLTVVSVIGVPPTLVASIYGMNFKVMPELNWALGYPYALCLIVLTTLIPLAWFKLKRWF
ncbi:magnesium/cobalt transporter CorA [soil metagenome]